MKNALIAAALFATTGCGVFHDQVEAQAYLEEAMALADENGLEIVDAWAHVYLGKLACHKGDIRAGRVFLQEGMELFEDLSYPMGTAWALRHLARAESDLPGTRRRPY